MLTALILLSAFVYAQNRLNVQVKEADSGEPLPGATVKLPALKRSSSSNAGGMAGFQNLPAGTYLLEVSYVGYVSVRDSISLPLTDTTARIYSLKEAEGEGLDEVVVSTTRASRTIANIPTRLEVIAGEELDEKANMKPGDIRMVLSESTGIQTQQTSATSGNASIRIQGLDGRYTQILKDGFPLFSGAASGLGLLQTPPLDLRQVEVIKGSASTLYGGGAIAGLVNLISKMPGDEPELSIHLNGTSAGGADINGFYSERYGKTGLTVFAARNSNKPYDPSDIDLTAIPRFERYTLNPRFFFWPGKNTNLSFGLNGSIEKRTGGDLHYIKGEGNDQHSYFEQNKSGRLSSQFSLTHQTGERSSLNVRNSFSYFNRRISVPAYSFDGSQLASFTELSYSLRGEKTEWVSGLNLWSDRFHENKKTGVDYRDYTQLTYGAFLQGNIHAASWLELEAGLRGDYVHDYGFVLLPRLSGLFKISRSFNSRLGGGLGYKTPTIFTEESERIQYQKVLPVSAGQNSLEKSYGMNWDLNYRTTLFNDQLSLSINQLFFYTFLNKPLMLEQQGADRYLFRNAAGHMDSRGMETNLKLVYSDLKLFLGYSYTDAQLHVGDVLQANPLTPRHRLNNVLMYEVEDKWKLGAEAYYYGKQKLNDQTTGKAYWIFGFMAEKLWDRFSLYINFENFTDTRQTRFDRIYTGSITQPQFRDIYAPLDGFVVNGGIKFRL